MSIAFLVLVRVLGPDQGRFPATTEVGVLVVGGAYLASWLLSIGRPRSHRVLTGIDVAATVSAGVGCALHGWLGPAAADARFDALLAINNALLVRAILIPSTPRRTLATGAVALLPIVLPAWAVAGGGLDVVNYLEPQLQAALFTGWGGIALLVPVLVSRVIYDLRAEVATAKTLGPYELGERIGAGGMGEVYRARHALLRRPTAIKVLRPGTTGEAAIARFEREVQLTASLTHPNTVAVYDFGRTADRFFYFAMELLDGRNLQEIVDATGPMEPRRVVHVLRQICGSLGEAHTRGLVHRDVKAANVILCTRGGQRDVVKVVDFGLAQPVSAPSTPEGLVEGTPAYLAPEAWGSGLVDPRTDLYAVGVLAHCLLSGSVPFGDSELLALVHRHVNEAPAVLETEPELARIVSTLLRKDPADRFASAGELDAALLLVEFELGAWTQSEAAAWWARHGTIKRADGSTGGLETTVVVPAPR